MTAGAGIIHAERPSEKMMVEGGLFHGFQLWVNLPAKDKLTPPKYQAILADTLAKASGDGWSAKVIGGELAGVRGPATSFTPITYAHVSVEANSSAELPVGDFASCGVYVFNGSATFGDKTLAPQQMAAFGAGDTIAVAGGPDGSEMMLMAGEPIGEPIARNGPFVMNTKEEVALAFAQYSRGELGSIKPIS